MMVLVCNPTYSGDRGGVILVWGRPWQKLAKPYLNRLGMRVQACNPSYLGVRSRRTVVCGQHWQTHEILFEEQTQSKRTGDMAQVVEHLPSNTRPKFNPQYSQKKNRQIWLLKFL
jgi:hypothetical protein